MSAPALRELELRQSQQLNTQTLALMEHQSCHGAAGTNRITSTNTANGTLVFVEELSAPAVPFAAIIDATKLLSIARTRLLLGRAHYTDHE